MEYNIISLGAGTQSTDLLLRSLRGEFDKVPDLAIFSDTGNEPKGVYKYLEWLIKYVDQEYNFTIDVTTGGNLYQDMLDYLDSNRKRPSGIPLFIKNPTTGKKSMLKRQCTGDYKIRPVRKFIRSVVQKKSKVNLWLGISYDELQRMKEADVKWLSHRFPLIEKRYKRIDCINNFKAHSIPVPVRSSCVVCPYHSDNYWLWIYENDPDNFEAATILDEKLRNYPGINDECFIHRSCRPLKEVIIDILKGKELSSKQLNMFPELIDECEGVCGI
ncbi:hypothetical protein [Aquimarina algiphila]|uniref:Phosphoadenosine phosphosulphate reductase domain-containing protein n=1 Tax=Aquimarina algiphila TaxID=2047982 RepID=A0A554VJ65_9FLAO|nr:hypothetical protein [Aquimarina algiphila]TSE07933.1 hypothetical protein FOF46_14505 [Aquimarina algiphila]